jgi:hypothetical protein
MVPIIGDYFASIGADPGGATVSTRLDAKSVIHVNRRMPHSHGRCLGFRAAGSQKARQRALAHGRPRPAAL